MSLAAPPRKSWPFLRTPLAVYLVVMLPICALQLFLLLGRTPAWMRASAAAVLLLTGTAFVRGYVRRLQLGPRGPRLVRLFDSIELEWSRIRRIGVYVPGGGLGATEYLYLTCRDEPPAGPWDIDRQTIQVQNRPGLLEAIERARAEQTCVTGQREGSGLP